MKKSELNDREEMLLNFFWKVKAPVTLAEMTEQLVQDGWSQVTIYKTVQNLSNKGYLEVVGFEKSVKTYARKLYPTMTKGEYYSELLINNEVGEESLIEVAAALVGASGLSKKKKDEKVISALEKIIEELKGN